MEVIEKEIIYENKEDTFTIHPLGDIHKGVIHCNEDLLDKEVSNIHSNPLALWIGMGDYGDLVVPRDFKRWDGKILAEWMKKHENNIGPTQLDNIDATFTPIWDQCIGLLEGNHEGDMEKHNHYSMMEELMKRANKHFTIPYGGVSCFVRLMFKLKDTTDIREILLHVRHGEGAARTSGARALAVLRLAMTFVNCHITLSGHLHGQESPDIPQRLILRQGKIRSFDTLATMTGAWLKAYAQGVPPCYLERWGSTPSVMGCPRIKITPYTGEITLEKSRLTSKL